METNHLSKSSGSHQDVHTGFFNRLLLRGIIAKHAKTKAKTILLGGFNHLEKY
jgi:hypothetical protein